MGFISGIGTDSSQCFNKLRSSILPYSCKAQVPGLEHAGGDWTIQEFSDPTVALVQENSGVTQIQLFPRALNALDKLAAVIKQGACDRMFLVPKPSL